MADVATANDLSYCVHWVEPVKRELFNALTASEASMLAVLLDYTFTEKEGEVWLNPIRDMPEHEEWIRQALKDGHAVTLIGKDVSLLLGRINDPLGFWKHNRGREKLVIWLSVLHRCASMEWLARNQGNRAYRRVYMTGDGSIDIVDLSAVSLNRPSAKDLMNMTMFMTPPTKLVGYASDSEGFDWYRSERQNESNLEILFFKSSHPYHTSTACVKVLSELDLTKCFGGARRTFVPDLVEDFTPETESAETCYIQTTFLNLNSGKQAFSARCRGTALSWLLGKKLRIGLDIPHIMTNQDSPIMVIPVSFHSTNMITYANSYGG